MSGIPILGPLTPPFGEFLHSQTTTPFAFTRYKAKKMQRSGREMRGAAPLWEIEPRPMGQDSFPAILERGKEASEAKEAKVESSEVEAPVTTEVQEMSAERSMYPYSMDYTRHENDTDIIDREGSRAYQSPLQILQKSLARQSLLGSRRRPRAVQIPASPLRCPAPCAETIVPRPDGYAGAIEGGAGEARASRQQRFLRLAIPPASLQPPRVTA